MAVIFQAYKQGDWGLLGTGKEEFNVPGFDDLNKKADSSRVEDIEKLIRGEEKNDKGGLRGDLNSLFESSASAKAAISADADRLRSKISDITVAFAGAEGVDLEAGFRAKWMDPERGTLADVVKCRLNELDEKVRQCFIEILRVKDDGIKELDVKVVHVVAKLDSIKTQAAQAAGEYDRFRASAESVKASLQTDADLLIEEMRKSKEKHLIDLTINANHIEDICRDVQEKLSDSNIQGLNNEVSILREENAVLRSRLDRMEAYRSEESKATKGFFGRIRWILFGPVSNDGRSGVTPVAALK